MDQEDVNTLLGLTGILLALSLGMVVTLVVVAFAAGLLAGRAWPRA